MLPSMNTGRADCSTIVINQEFLFSFCGYWVQKYDHSLNQRLDLNHLRREWQDIRICTKWWRQRNRHNVSSLTQKSILIFGAWKAQCSLEIQIKDQADEEEKQNSAVRVAYDSEFYSNRFKFFELKTYLSQAPSYENSGQSGRYKIIKGNIISLKKQSKQLMRYQVKSHQWKSYKIQSIDESN